MMTELPTHKHCPRCDTTQPLEAFYKNRRRPDGRSAFCSTCDRDRAKAYRATPEGRAATTATWNRYVTNTQRRLGIA